MADAQPLSALHYDLDRVGELSDVISPPYDVIDPQQRERLLTRSPHNVVAIDLPVGDDPYETAATTLDRWIAEGLIIGDTEPALWAIQQDYTGPTGESLTRRGLFARVRIEEYGAGRVRPHERTHPGPKEDRLRLTRATKTNLSPIFALHEGDAWTALGVAGDPWATATDDDGTLCRLWRITDPERISAAQGVLGRSELLIADGHHRYETARVYAEEIGEGRDAPSRFVLMCLVSMEDPGLTVFPTHRLVKIPESSRQEALATTLKEHFAIEEIDRSELRPGGWGSDNGPLTLGYIDSHFKRAFRLTLKDQASADDALSGFPEPYRRLDTAVLESLILKGPLGLSDDDISHLNGLGYSRTDDEALQLVLDGSFDAAFFMRSTPVSQVREIAATGVNMPPKSTFFYPKIPTGLLFNPLQ
jgi:uncharacterized protein (DUF1015 family)